MKTQKQVLYSPCLYTNENELVPWHLPTYEALKEQNLIDALLSTYKERSQELFAALVIRDNTMLNRRIEKVIKYCDDHFLMHHFKHYSNLPPSALSLIFDRFEDKIRTNEELLFKFYRQAWINHLSDDIKDKLDSILSDQARKLRNKIYWKEVDFSDVLIVRGGQYYIVIDWMKEHETRYLVYWNDHEEEKVREFFEREIKERAPRYLNT